MSRYRLLTQDRRRRNIARPELKNGDAVIDVGCGTGFSFPIIEEAVGPLGRILGIEQSAERNEQAVEPPGASAVPTSRGAGDFHGFGVCIAIGRK
jgi:protein-L-isoaspartate O-methyltransferase